MTTSALAHSTEPWRTPQATTHRVASGETLTGIARRYGVTIAQIRQWNRGLNDTIRPGQRIRIERPRSVG